MQNHCEHQIGESSHLGIPSEESPNSLKERGVDETLVLAIGAL